MPNRDPLKCEERRGNGARHEGTGQGRHEEDSTARTARNRAVVSTPEGRKSTSTRDERRAALLEAMAVPAPWKRLGDLLPEVTS
jgi:hypothetical protein